MHIMKNGALCKFTARKFFRGIRKKNKQRKKSSCRSLSKITFSSFLTKMNQSVWDSTHYLLRYCLPSQDTHSKTYKLLWRGGIALCWLRIWSCMKSWVCQRPPFVPLQWWLLLPWVFSRGLVSWCHDLCGVLSTVSGWWLLSDVSDRVKVSPILKAGSVHMLWLLLLLGCKWIRCFLQAVVCVRIREELEREMYLPTSDKAEGQAGGRGSRLPCAPTTHFFPLNI